MPENKITVEYFLKEYHDFRDIMCSLKYSVDDKLNAYKGLFFVYINVDPKDKRADLVIGAMQALDVELNMRLGYQQLDEITARVRERMAR